MFSSPVLLSLLRTVVERGQAAGVPVSLCGEMAARPLDAMALIGIGFRSLVDFAAGGGRDQDDGAQHGLASLTLYMDRSVQRTAG